MKALLSPSRTAQKGLRAPGLQAIKLRTSTGWPARSTCRDKLGNDVAFSKFLGSTEALSFAAHRENAAGFEKTLDGVTNSAGATETAFNVLATQLGTAEG